MYISLSPEADIKKKVKEAKNPFGIKENKVKGRRGEPIEKPLPEMRWRHRRILCMKTKLYDTKYSKSIGPE
ncbi:hypothetical protein RO3G_08981 [Rhizopus delemar RA 99-880]|uniref:Uncharacterized protein n=1 Tax=Rhizopus delemar (strain RA 99-880 / ATCC MYA-4621 / FGSC 9543 / NRRL 43880) TaxID=246409 RepID=I1C741_RHIO9|nr:hypothetical protein RO3G_08981 [Rhizopus delemar RA 99-880]|eukprot:EIE84271.1 hypothetical protein RO3G_08981 [Rhizopus delemar RA 99-880]